MDAEVVRWMLTALMGIVIWFGKRMIDSNERRIEFLETDNQNIKQNYIHKEDFKDFKVELRAMFDEIKQNIKDLKFHAG